MTTIRRIMLIDVETSSTDPATGALLEVAMAIYSLEHRSFVRARSWLVQAEENDAIAVNGIRPELLRSGVPAEDVHRQIQAIATKEVQAVTSWNWSFDGAWLPELANMPNFCSMDDVPWPRPSTSKSLAAVALAHGVGVLDAHRALTDVMTMVRLFDRVSEIADLSELVAKAMRPKATFEVADKSFDEERNRLAKENGFRWDAGVRGWRRRMAIADVAALPFEVRRVS